MRKTGLYITLGIIISLTVFVLAGILYFQPKAELIPGTKIVQKPAAPEKESGKPEQPEAVVVQEVVTTKVPPPVQLSMKVTPNELPVPEVELSTTVTPVGPASEPAEETTPLTEETDTITAETLPADLPTELPEEVITEDTEEVTSEMITSEDCR